MPGNVSGFMAHEVADVQSIPKRLVGLKRFCVQGQQRQGFALAPLHFGGGIRRAAAQHAQCVAVKVFQQLALPGIPDLGAGTANVSHREQIQGRQIAFIADSPGKCRNHFRVAQVFLLRGTAHAQVLAHQKFSQVGVTGGNAVLAAKNANFLAAQLGMVAAASLGDVMEQRGNVQNPGLVPACGQLRTHRVFVRMLGHEKPPDIAQHHQDVLIDRVNMKQIMLHLPDDVAKHPEVTAQH